MEEFGVDPRPHPSVDLGLTTHLTPQWRWILLHTTPYGGVLADHTSHQMVEQGLTAQLTPWWSWCSPHNSPHVELRLTPHLTTHTVGADPTPHPSWGCVNRHLTPRGAGADLNLTPWWS